MMNDECRMMSENEEWKDRLKAEGGKLKGKEVKSEECVMSGVRCMTSEK
jgi:hypothetical protein